MKLSHNMLNFLGWAYEQNNFLSYDMCMGLATYLGLKAALKNGLLEGATHTLTVGSRGPIPGVPYGHTYKGFKLTEKGRTLGEIGAEMRKACCGYADTNTDSFVMLGRRILANMG